MSYEYNIKQNPTSHFADTKITGKYLEDQTLNLKITLETSQKLI